MDTALSLKYAHLLLNAKLANYQDYLDLGLVCPSCHQPVYLVAGRKVANSRPRRTRSGELKSFKPYQTEPYFAHFQSECGHKCPLARDTTATISSSLVTTARNQRLQLFESKLELIFALNPRFDRDRLIHSIWLRVFLRTNRVV